MRAAFTRIGGWLWSAWWLLIAACGLAGVIVSVIGVVWAAIVVREVWAVVLNILGVVASRWWMVGGWVRFRTGRRWRTWDGVDPAPVEP